MKHSVCSGGVIVNSFGKIAIVNQQHNSWSLPKGHIDEGEDLLSTAKREIFEETGVLSLTLVQYLGEYDRHALNSQGIEVLDETKTIHFYLFTTLETDLKPKDIENPMAIWVDLDTAITLLTHKKDKDFLQTHSPKICELIKNQTV